MQFIDEVTVFVRAGNGGNGCVSFRREKYVPKGGPDGGNGGHGGSVVIRADRHLSTLLDFKYRKQYLGERGEHGKGKKQDGKWGTAIVLKVPCGTIVRDAESGAILADLTDHQQEVLVARGGRGGRGNAEFATPTNRAPRHAEPGTAGEERSMILELKLIADVGLVGLPNSGKSTLISVISAAKPKIADYPFTTLHPNLGIVRIAEERSFVVADIPGLIEGAHQGKGLGLQFLRHIERTKVLVFLVEAISRDPKKDFKILFNELKSHDPALTRKPKVVAVTKIDLLSHDELRKLKKVMFGRAVQSFFISSVANKGIDDLVKAMWKVLQKRK
ncbi:MAG: GTPase ObgE [Ignavibacteriales bacterium]|nr:GTPase ObgE [Ignavibacteriales bacterium]